MRLGFPRTCNQTKLLKKITATAANGAKSSSPCYYVRKQPQTPPCPHDGKYEKPWWFINLKRLPWQCKQEGMNDGCSFFCISTVAIHQTCSSWGMLKQPFETSIIKCVKQMYLKLSVQCWIVGMEHNRAESKLAVPDAICCSSNSRDGFFSAKIANSFSTAEWMMPLQLVKLPGASWTMPTPATMAQCAMQGHWMKYQNCVPNGHIPSWRCYHYNIVFSAS